jgi:hypothetical protein
MQDLTSTLLLLLLLLPTLLVVLWLRLSILHLLPFEHAGQACRVMLLLLLLLLISCSLSLHWAANNTLLLLLLLLPGVALTRHGRRGWPGQRRRHPGRIPTAAAVVGRSQVRLCCSCSEVPTVVLAGSWRP